jgi:hypothetical protein
MYNGIDDCEFNFKKIKITEKIIKIIMKINKGLVLIIKNSINCYPLNIKITAIIIKTIILILKDKYDRTKILLEIFIVLYYSFFNHMSIYKNIGVPPLRITRLSKKCFSASWYTTYSAFCSL